LKFDHISLVTSSSVFQLAKPNQASIVDLVTALAVSKVTQTTVLAPLNHAFAHSQVIFATDLIQLFIKSTLSAVVLAFSDKVS